jgi:hypothetical protein
VATNYKKYVHNHDYDFDPDIFDMHEIGLTAKAITNVMVLECSDQETKIPASFEEAVTNENYLDWKNAGYMPSKLFVDRSPDGDAIGEVRLLHASEAKGDMTRFELLNGCLSTSTAEEKKTDVDDDDDDDQPAELLVDMDATQMAIRHRLKEDESVEELVGIAVVRFGEEAEAATDAGWDVLDDAINLDAVQAGEMPLYLACYFRDPDLFGPEFDVDMSDLALSEDSEDAVDDDDHLELVLSGDEKERGLNTEFFTVLDHVEIELSDTGDGTDYFSQEEKEDDRPEGIDDWDTDYFSQDEKEEDALEGIDDWAE